MKQRTASADVPHTHLEIKAAAISDSGPSEDVRLELETMAAIRCLIIANRWRIESKILLKK